MAATELYNRASASLETRRIPDTYHYRLIDGLLVSEDTKEVVCQVVETDTYLGQSEFVGLLGVQKWIAQNSKGTAVWISAPYREDYLVPKIIVSQIVYVDGEKALFNRAIVVDDLTAANCSNFARDLNQNAPTDLEELRATPISVKEGVDWLDELGKYVDTIRIRKLIESKQDIREKRRLVKTLFVSHAQGIPLAEIQIEMGDKALRCGARGQTAFRSLFEVSTTSSDEYGSLEFKCPKCEGTNRRPPHSFISNCQICGADVRC